MAQFYGKNSIYLLKNDLKYSLWAVGLIVLPLLLAAAAVKYFGITSGLFIAVVIIIIILAQASEPLIDLFKKKSGQFYHGFGGELDIKRELEKLSNDFTVFHGLQIGNNKGDMDFVVLGPSGVFLLEVKSHKGEVGFNGLDLTLNGRLFKDKSLIRQVHGETWALKNYLKIQTGKDIFIHSVLVFSSPYAYMHFGYNPMSNIYVIQKDFLPDLFNRFPKFPYPVDVSEIKQALLKTVKK